jgi:hypothetical protein
MDITAIDDSDDFGTSPSQTAPIGKHCSVKTTVFGLSLIVSALCLAADISLSHTVRVDSNWQWLGAEMAGQDFVTKALEVVAISQISFAVSGILSIIKANMWAWPKFFPSTRQRTIYELSKWSITTILIMADAYFLEHLYELIFIFQHGDDFFKIGV